MEMTICSSCGKELPLTTEYFHKTKARKCGLCARCKECVNKAAKAYREKYKDKIRGKDRERRSRERERRIVYSREYYKNNKERLKAEQSERNKRDTEKRRAERARYYLEHREEVEAERAKKEAEKRESGRRSRREYYQRNRERLIQYQREHRKRNGEYLAEQKRIWRAENPEESRARVKAYQKNNPEVKKRCRDNYRSTPAGRMRVIIGNRIRDSLRNRKNNRSWEKITGYTVETLVKHLESQFRDGMSWSNYGEWHIDHIRPVASFDFNVKDPFAVAKECWALPNLRPLWAIENLQKGARYEGEAACNDI